MAALTPDHLLAEDDERHVPQNFDNALNNTGPYKGSGIIQSLWNKKDVRLFTSLSDSTTSGTSEEVLKTYDLPANTLELFAEGIYVEVWGKFAAGGANKILKLKLDGNVLVTNTLVNPSNRAFLIKSWIYNENASTDPATAFITTHLNIATVLPDIQNTQITLTNSIINTFQVTAQDASAGLTTVEGMMITMRNSLETGGNN